MGAKKSPRLYGNAEVLDFKAFARRKHAHAQTQQQDQYLPVSYEGRWHTTVFPGPMGTLTAPQAALGSFQQPPGSSCATASAPAPWTPLLPEQAGLRVLKQPYSEFDIGVLIVWGVFLLVCLGYVIARLI